MPTKDKVGFAQNHLRKIAQDVQKAERELAIPRWYRGLSTTQVAAESGLANALRDDLEQGTSHRTKQCLKVMGLQPIVPDKALRISMKLSRGSDVAFIYFLLEKFYKTPDHMRTQQNGFYNYNRNEQILMTSIYHLDVILTLYELNKILPPGHPPLAKLEKLEKLAKKKEKESASKKVGGPTKKSDMKCSILPYFQNQPKPKHYGKPLHCPRPNFKIKFHFEDKLKNLNYTTPNEANRWFVEFQLQPTKRAAKAVVDECIGKIFRSHVHDWDCPNTFKCEHYKVVSEVQNILECRFNFIVKDKCLNVWSNKDPEYRERLDMLINRVIDDVTEYLKMYSIARMKPAKYIIQLNNPNGTTVYFVTLSELKIYVETFRNLYLNKRTTMCAEEADELVKIIKEFPTVLNIKRDGKCAIELDINQEPVKSDPSFTLKICDCECGHVIKEEKSLIENPKPKLRLADGRENHSTIEEKLPEGAELMTECVKSNEKFFKAPTSHTPFGFDFTKILKYNESESDKVKIKKIFLEALNEKATHKYTFDNTLSGMPNLGEAVNHLANELFTKNAEECARITKHEHPISPLFLQTRLDCNDEKLMNTMLEQAFCYLRRNPKLLLVTLPDAHKLPVFGFFITRRYGKSYSSADRYKLMNKSMKLFDGILRLFFNKYNLKNKPIPGFTIGYDHKKCLKQKFEPIVKEYYERLQYLMLEQARLFWIAARPSLGLYERTRLPFYSYTPARWSDIKFFRVWKSDEYRDMTAAWKRRVVEAKRAL